MMEGHPVLLRPEGTLRIITLGGSGGIHQDPNDRVLKAPLKYNTEGCNREVIASVASREEFSEECINREKLVYQTLPKDDPNILKCLSIAERGIQLPYLQHRDVRNYLQNHEVDVETRDRWIQNAVDAIATVHACGIVHSDISPRNFLVTDHLSIQLCDFAGSRINDLHSLVEEETRYRLPLSPSSPRTAITDLFALGSFIYEISTGTSPFPDLDDDEIERRYASLDFPSLDGLKYHKVISKCWNSQYSSADMIRGDIRRLRKPSTFDTERLGPSFIFSVLAMISIGFTVWTYKGRNR
jgi:serine/threonine protein kinase